MDDDYIRQRVDSILRRKIAMGGCNDYGDGVMVGGDLLGGYGTSKGAKKSPWVKFLKKWYKDHGISYGEAMQSPKARAAYYRQKGGRPKKKAPVRRRPPAGLTAYQRARVRKHYLSRGKKGKLKGACINYDKYGPYYLNDKYKCVQSKLYPKKNAR